MKCLDKFKSKMNYSGGSLRDERIKDSKHLLEETFVDDASFKKGMYMWELGRKTYTDSKPLKIRLFKRSFSAANGTMFKFQTLYDNPIVVGDIIYDSITNEHLICTESFNIDDIHWQGKLTLCNWILKWQNENCDILEYPCYDINATQYNSGEHGNKQFTTGSSQHMITLPSDENTIILESPQRFFLDKNCKNPTSFIVTQNDTTSNNYGKKGLIKLTVCQCLSNSSTDRIDIGICDYKEKSVIETNNDSHITGVSKSIISYDSKVIRSGGDAQTFIGKFYDEKGNELFDIAPKWIVISSFLNILNIKENGNQITISIDDDNYIDEEIKLIYSDINNNYKSELIIRIGSLLYG